MAPLTPSAPAGRLVSLVILFAVCCLPSRAWSAAATPQASVQQWVGAWNAHDAKALANMLESDVAFVLVSGKLLNGPIEFHEVHRAQFSGRYSSSNFAVTEPARVVLIKPDVAVVTWRWAITDVRNEDGTPSPTYHGIFTWVEVRHGKAWKIRAAQNTIDR